MTMITQHCSVAKSIGCLQWHLFVCLFVYQHKNFHTSKLRMMKLGIGVLYKNLFQVQVWGS